MCFCVCDVIKSAMLQHVWDMFSCTADGWKTCCGSWLKGDWPSTRNWQGEWCQSPNRPLYGALGLFSLLLQSLVSIARFKREKMILPIPPIYIFAELFAGKLVVSKATRQGHMHSSFRSTKMPSPSLTKIYPQWDTTMNEKMFLIRLKIFMSKQLGMCKSKFLYGKPQ